MIGRTLAVTVGALVLAASQDVEACSCAPPPDPEGAFQRADVVFEGEAVDIDTPHLALGWLILKHKAAEWLATSAPSEHDYASAEKRVTFKVTRVWKGDVTGPIVISTGYGGGDCGFPFVPGERYLVYAYTSAGFFTTGICGRTTEVASAASDLTYLAQRE